MQLKGIPYSLLCPAGECQCKDILYKKVEKKYLSGVIAFFMAFLFLFFAFNTFSQKDYIGTFLLISFFIVALYLGYINTLKDYSKTGFNYFDQLEINDIDGKFEIKFSNTETNSSTTIRLLNKEYRNIAGANEILETIENIVGVVFIIYVNQCDQYKLLTFYTAERSKTNRSKNMVWKLRAQIALKQDDAKKLLDEIKKRTGNFTAIKELDPTKLPPETQYTR
jgi:hypothetical protein